MLNGGGMAMIGLGESSGPDRAQDATFEALDSPLLDIDVHVIPARKGEPEHEHHDMRVLLVARDGQQLAISDESIDLRWFEWSELETVGEQDQSILRLARKAREQLNRIGKNIDGH